MAIVIESTNPAGTNPAGRGYVVGVSNLDAALEQSKAAAAHIAAAAAAIRQLPHVDVVTDRVSDSAGAQAIHASVSADIRDQLSRPVREALAGLAAACHRWVPVQGTVAVNISGEVNKDTIRAISETVRRAITAAELARVLPVINAEAPSLTRPPTIDSSRLTLELAGHTFGARFATATQEARLAGLPVVVDATQGDALFAYLGSQPGTYQHRLAEYRAVRGSSLESIATANVGAARAIFLANRLTRGAAGYQGKAIGLDGGVIDVDFGVEVAAWNGAYIIIPAKDMGTGLEILKRYTTA